MEMSKCLGLGFYSALYVQLLIFLITLEPDLQLGWGKSFQNNIIL